MPTDGYVCADTHIHTFTYSRHGDATIDERMLTLAGEGIELPIATDHNLTVDYEPVASKLGVRRYFTPVIGDEVTTASLGHFNVFPLARDSRLIDWRLPSWARLSRDIARKGTRRPRCGRSGHHPEPRPRHARRLPAVRPEPPRELHRRGRGRAGNSPANAMEVVNSGATLTDPMLLVRDWFGLMNRGRFLTPVGASDSHDVSRYIVGQGRTYVRSASTDPGKIDVGTPLEQFRAGRVLVSYGLLADIRWPGSTARATSCPLRSSRGPAAREQDAGEDRLNVHVRVLGPAWTRASRVMLFANGVEVKRQDIGAAGRGDAGAGGREVGDDLFPAAAEAGRLARRRRDWPRHPEALLAHRQAVPAGVAGVSAVRAGGDRRGAGGRGRVGKFESPYDYAAGIVTDADGDVAKVIAALEGTTLRRQSRRRVSTARIRSTWGLRRPPRSPVHRCKSRRDSGVSARMGSNQRPKRIGNSAAVNALGGGIRNNKTRFDLQRRWLPPSVFWREGFPDVSAKSGQTKGQSR